MLIIVMLFCYFTHRFLEKIQTLEMNKHIRRSVIIFALSIEENFAENFLLWPFILIIQIVIAYFLFLRNYILIIGTWNENFTIVFQILTGKLYTSLVIFGIFGLCILLILVLAFFILLTPKNETEIDRFKDLRDNFVILGAFVLVILEIAMLPIGFALFEKLQTFTSYQSFILAPVSILVLLFVLYINRTERMFGICYIILPLSLPNLDIVITVIYGLIGIYEMWKDLQQKNLLLFKTRMRFISHALLLVICVWAQILKEETDPLVDFIILHASLVFIGVSIPFYWSEFNNPLTSNFFLCSCFTEKKKDNLDEEKILDMEIVMHDHYNTMDENEESEFQISDTPPIKYWEEQKLHEQILAKISYEKSRKNNLNGDISYLQSCLFLNTNAMLMLDEIYNVLSNHHNLSFLDEYKVIKFRMKSEKKYFQSKFNTENTSIIMNYSILEEQFLTAMKEQIKELKEFWERVKEEQYVTEYGREGMMISFFKIIDKDKFIYQLIERMEQIMDAQAKRQRQLYNYLLQFIKPRRKGSVNQQIFQFTSNYYYNYVKVQNNKIKVMSIMFFCEMGYKDEGRDINQFIGIDVDRLFPEKFGKKILQFWEKNGKQINEYEPFIMLVYNAIGDVDIMWCSPLVIPNLINGVELIYKFTKHEAATIPFVLYSTLTNMIMTYNTTFINEFSMDREKISQELSGYGILSHNLFQSIALDDKEIQEKLRVREDFNCTIDSTKFVKNKEGEDNCFNKIDVNVGLIEEFEFNHNKYMLLRVSKGHITKAAIFGSKKKEQNSNFNGEQSVEGQDFFCKIPNPYETKINEKQSFLENRYRFNYPCIISTLIFLIVIVGILQMGAAYQLLYEQINNNIVEQQIFKQQKALYAELFAAYYSVQLYYQINLLQNDISYNDFHAKSILSKLKAQTFTHVKKFQQIYLSKEFHEGKGKSYNLQFQYYDIDTDLAKTNLLDFSQNLVVFELSDSIQFLSNNYLTLKELSKAEELSAKLSNQSFGEIILYIFLGITLLTILLIYILLVKLQIIIQEVESLFKEFKEKNFQMILHRVARMKEKFDQLDVYKEQENKNYVKIDSKKKGKSKKISYKQLPQDEKENEHHDDSYQVKNHKWKIIGRQFPYIIFFFLILTIDIIELQKFSQYQEYFEGLRIFQNNLQKVNLAIYTKTLDFYVPLIAEQLGNEVPKVFDLAKFKKTIVQKQLPIPELKQRYHEILFGNLCSKIKNIEPINEKIKCPDVFHGVLESGLPQASNSYDNMVMNLMELNFEQVISQKNGKYLDFIELNYAFHIITKTNTEISDLFYTEINKIPENYAQNQRNLIIIQAGAFTIISVVLGIYLRGRLSRRSQTGIGYFNSYPSSILLNMEVTTQIRQKNLLDQLDCL